jgi:putative phosphoribosyl transferase
VVIEESLDGGEGNDSQPADVSKVESAEELVMNNCFKDRRNAGRFLASKLSRHAHREDALVLALPRGGVPVGYEIALALGLPLDVFVVRKLGAPLQEELAIGAIATGGVRVLNEALIQQLGISPGVTESITAAQERELQRREQLYRGIRPPVQVRDKRVILVDDGLATGASMRAAIQALRQHGPEQIVIAVPVGAVETCRDLQREVEEVVCGRCPDDLGAVGLWYEDFTQTTDEEVAQLLQHIAHERQGSALLTS